MRSGIQQVTAQYAQALADLSTVYLARFNYQELRLEFQKYSCAPDLKMRETTSLDTERLMKDRENVICFIPEVPLNRHLSAAHVLVNQADAHGVPTVALLHDLIPFAYPTFYSPRATRAFVRYLRFLQDRCDLVAISDQTKEHYYSYCELTGTGEQCAQPMIPVVSNGFKRMSPREARLDYEQKGRAKRILFVSTVEPRKNQLLACEVIDEIERSLGVQVELELVGSDEGYDQGYVRQVEAFVRSKEHWRWSKNLSNDEVRQSYEAADFTCYLSEVEGLGMPVVESVMYGKPCITTENVPAGSLQGCIQLSIRDLKQISHKVLEDLLTDDNKLAKLRKDCEKAQWPSWNSAAEQLLGNFRALRP